VLSELKCVDPDDEVIDDSLPDGPGDHHT